MSEDYYQGVKNRIKSGQKTWIKKKKKKITVLLQKLPAKTKKLVLPHSINSQSAYHAVPVPSEEQEPLFFIFAF